jgi:predicted transcriptional regulator of viral defense system
MKWEELIQIVGKESVFSSNLLKAGNVNPIDLSKQLSRWVESKKLVQIRRGLYALSERYRKTEPHPFYIANRIRRASYVSLQSALEHYGLIPEYVPTVTSVTTGRPQTFKTPLGNYIYRHIKKEFFFDYTLEQMTAGQSAFIASPEKALLDLLYLTPRSDDTAYLEELRLQNMDNMDIKRFHEKARSTGSPKLIRASNILENLAEDL